MTRRYRVRVRVVAEVVREVSAADPTSASNEARSLVLNEAGVFIDDATPVAVELVEEG